MQDSSSFCQRSASQVYENYPNDSSTYIQRKYKISIFSFPFNQQFINLLSNCIYEAVSYIIFCSISSIIVFSLMPWLHGFLSSFSFNIRALAALKQGPLWQLKTNYRCSCSAQYLFIIDSSNTKQNHLRLSSCSQSAHVQWVYFCGIFNFSAKSTTLNIM